MPTDNGNDLENLRRAEMPLAFEYLHSILNLPPDVHIVGAYVEADDCPDLSNLVLKLEAFADGAFPSRRVTAQFHEDWNIKTGKRDVIFDGWIDVT